MYRLKKFEVKKLNGIHSFTIDFNNDLNIITGKNGSGKTTVINLLWYLLSGKVDEAVHKIDFEYAKLVTNKMEVIIDVNDKIKYIINDPQYGKIENEIEFLNNDMPALQKRTHYELRREKIKEISSVEKSIFFPTYRRIEGGFPDSFSYYFRRRSNEEELDHIMTRISKSLSDEQHLFVTSISTNDIKELLTDKYAKVSEEINKLHSDMNKYISKEIEKSQNNQSPERVLNRIKEEVNKVEKEKKLRLKNFESLSKLVKRLFHDKGIKLSDSITLGDSASKALSSNYLSAGEKQMLSFLCYNLFYDKTTIFIDEPEISLHVDWQRMLMKILFAQESSNQYIITTHSPFILSKYSDREIMLDNDRGGF